MSFCVNQKSNREAFNTFEFFLKIDYFSQFELKYYLYRAILQFFSPLSSHFTVFCYLVSCWLSITHVAFLCHTHTPPDHTRQQRARHRARANGPECWGWDCQAQESTSDARGKQRYWHFYCLYPRSCVFYRYYYFYACLVSGCYPYSTFYSPIQL